jgi:hypothetical protein
MSDTEGRGNPPAAGTPAGPPRYLGLRRDKDLAAVTREVAR